MSVRGLEDILGKKLKDSFVTISEKTRTGKLLAIVRKREAVPYKPKKTMDFGKATT